MATHYGVNATKSNDSRTLGAAQRFSSTGEGVRYWNDSFVIVTDDYAANDIIRLGPFKAGEKIIGSTLRITGDATVDLGDDIDVGWAYVDGTGTADPDAFVAGTFDASAATIDVLGAVMHDGTVDSGLYAPPTNDRDWWLTVTCITNTGEAAGTVYFESFVKTFN